MVTRLAAAISLAGFIYYLRRGDLLLYGDAVAHINIARRIFDSLTPGLGQLGTVWLPLPHLLIAPFLVSDRLWRTGVGAAIPSLIAYVLAAAGIYRLTRELVASRNEAKSSRPATAGLIAALVFACNPNIIYLQTTAMNEVIYLTFFIWAVVWLQRFTVSGSALPVSPSKALICSGVLLCAACLSRYEGWVIAALCSIAAPIILARQRRLRASIRPLVIFWILAAAAPVFWLSYNRLVYGNALEFANGYYSARAIEQRSIAAGGARNPASQSATRAAAFYGEAVLGDLGESRIARSLVLALGIAGALLLARPSASSALLLWTPFPFYIYSIAYGSVPIFVPTLWPWSYYNVRYGTSLLPAIAVGLAITVVTCAGLLKNRAARRGVFAACLAAVAISYASAYFQPHHRGHYPLPGEPERGPLVWREAVVNSFPRQAFDQQLVRVLAQLPPNSRLLMSLTSDVGALQSAGIPLRRVINEGNSRPLSTTGLWNDALASPAASADFIIAIEGDPVASAVARHPAGLELMLEVHSGQARARIYRSLLRH